MLNSLHAVENDSSYDHIKLEQKIDLVKQDFSYLEKSYNDKEKHLKILHDSISENQKSMQLHFSWYEKQIYIVEFLLLLLIIVSGIWYKRKVDEGHKSLNDYIDNLKEKENDSTEFFRSTINNMHQELTRSITQIDKLKEELKTSEREFVESDKKRILHEQEYIRLKGNVEDLINTLKSTEDKIVIKKVKLILGQILDNSNCEQLRDCLSLSVDESDNINYEESIDEEDTDESDGIFNKVES